LDPLDLENLEERLDTFSQVISKVPEYMDGRLPEYVEESTENLWEQLNLKENEIKNAVSDLQNRTNEILGKMHSQQQDAVMVHMEGNNGH